VKLIEEKLLDRVNCCICGSHELRESFRLESFPIYMGTTSDSPEGDLFADQIWNICGECGCIQLRKLIPIEILYESNHSGGPVGKIWKDHHSLFASIILSTHSRSILEIGGAHGFLAELILTASKNIKYTMIEPSVTRDVPGVAYVKGFIENNLDLLKEVDKVVHSHVLEHLYEPIEFLNQVSRNMRLGSQMFMSIPNIARLIATDGANSLNFEHTYYLSTRQLEFVLNRLGFKVKEKRAFLQHSYFYWVEKVYDQSIHEELPNIETESILFASMWEKLKEFVNRVNMYLDKEKDIPVYIFGAHVFAQSLIHLGLQTKSIVGILDNSPSKIGERLYGTNLQVFSPEVIKNYNRVIVVLKASHYQDEISAQLRSLNNKVVILD